MNFFEHQDQARAHTKRLVFLFSLAVLALVAITTLFTALLLHFSRGAAIPSPEQGAFWSDFFAHMDWHLVAMVGLAVVVLVGLGSLYRLAQLNKGGAAVAESLNGRLLNVSQCDAKERRLLNVVEEMAIAAGVPVPPVYLLDEPGINAFAAGYKPQDAVIGVTRGCIEQLNRDQLQGVIAHEYSHILHGDMRLNLRLVGVLHGILLIGLLGEMLMRSGSRSRKNGGGIALFGLGLLVIGYAGTFFGNLIKAAVSRQREFLADASAVQFTRNPAGISGALKRIGGHASGSQLEAANAAEYSHFYFASGLSSWLGGALATHPPLAQRIKRIDPRWQGEFDTQAPAEDAGEMAEGVANFAGQSASVSADNLADHVGNPAPAALAEAGATLAGLNPLIREAAHNSASAMAIIYGLLYCTEAADKQQAIITANAPGPVARLYRQLLPAIQALPVKDRLPVIELCIPALKALSEPQRTSFRKNIIAQIKADNVLSLTEWCVYRLLQHNLFPQARTQATNLSLDQVADSVRSLLTLMVLQGDSAHRQPAYQQALEAIGLPVDTLMPEADPFPVIDKHLARLYRVKPLQKPRLLKGLMLAIQADGQVQIAEYELLRVIADSLDCPMPILH